VANVFGIAATEGSSGSSLSSPTPGTEAATAPLVDPRPERANRRRFLRGEIPDLAHANAVYCTSGRWPCRVWILVRRGDLNAVFAAAPKGQYDTNFYVTIDDGQNPPLTFLQLALVQARCVSRGNAADVNAVYLVELTDRRGVLWTPWFSFGTNSAYNVRAPAYDGVFHDYSLNRGTPWTWDTMVGDLWNQVSAVLGPYPHLPVSPQGTPEGFSFPGVPLWTSLCDVLDLLGLSVVEDNPPTQPYTIVGLTASDSAYTARVAKYANVLQDDLEYVEPGSGRVPGNVVVNFHRRNQFYGTEETVRHDAPQWEAVPLYQVTVTAAQAGFSAHAAATGAEILWDDYEVRYDTDGNPLAADTATAAAIAVERATQFYAKIRRTTSGYSKQVYAGVLPFTTGSQVDGVAWKMDFQSGRQGWVTEVVRGPQPPWKLVEVRGGGE
jgi:hypothetical protein